MGRSGNGARKDWGGVEGALKKKKRKVIAVVLCPCCVSMIPFPDTL